MTDELMSEIKAPKTDGSIIMVVASAVPAAMP